MDNTLKINQILQQIDSLDYVSSMHLLEELVKKIKDKVVPPPTPKKVSLTQLKGLGKEIWLGMDTMTYIHNERNSW